MQRNNNRVNPRHFHNLCPNCFSKLEADKASNVKCTGDKLASWQSEITKYLKLSSQDAQLYLQNLSNPTGFLNLIDVNSGLAVCGFDSRITPVISSSQQRIPDPMVVNKLERKLNRLLTELEQEEGFEFVVDNKVYTIPFINFPDDL